MKWYKYIITALFMALLIPLGITSCNQEELVLTGDEVQLTFSSDTLAFDTVFTTMGTTTQVLLVYNPLDQPISIENITLQGGYASRFRLNVDGDTALCVRHKVLAAHDSLYLFVRACINPNSQLEPFLVEDAILFDYGTHSQRVILTAYGRNAVYHQPDHVIYDAVGNAIPYSIIRCAQWDHTRPHVIFGFAVVDEGDVLHLQAGDQLYFSDDACLWVYDGGTLDARGSATAPILFTSLRHDASYDSLPGQWNYIWLNAGSLNNVIDWARIENGVVGLRVDTNVNSQPTLRISNTQVQNQSTAGIIGQGSVIEGHNLLVANCGVATLALQYGGDYLFTNSTFADYWRYDTRTNPSIILNNCYEYTPYSGAAVVRYPRDLRRAEFRNCILYGNYSGTEGEGEISFQNNPSAQFNVTFDHCLIRSGLIDSADHPDAALLLNRDPQFLAPYAHNYHLLPSSPAVAAGCFVSGISTDLDGRPRANPPAIGAYEYCDTSLLKTNNRQLISPCTAISMDPLLKSLRPMRSSIARGSAINLKYRSTPIHR